MELVNLAEDAVTLDTIHKIKDTQTQHQPVANTPVESWGQRLDRT